MKIKALRQMVGVYGRLDPGVVTEVPDHVAEELISLGRAVEAKDEPPAPREDGPTVGEFVAAGYLASNYPSEGYAPRSTPEEIAAAIEAQNKPKQEEPGEGVKPTDEDGEDSKGKEDKPAKGGKG